MAIAFITHKDCLLHNTGDFHPECPERLQVINDNLSQSAIQSSLVWETAHKATRAQLERVHDKQYIESIFNRSPKEGFVRIDPDTMMNPGTLNAALLAAGAVIKAVNMVLENKVESAFCSIRPPGHHAEHNRAMGFCFFNNIAVGAAHALAVHQLNRIAIIDFDAHRGNGTDDIFQNHKQILICSLYEHFLYPAIPPPKADNIIDLPLSARATGSQLRAKFSQKVIHAIEAFNPELILISAGFDGHADDAISTLRFIESDYHWLTQQIKTIARKSCAGRLVSVLEGGYALNVLGACVETHLEALK